MHGDVGLDCLKTSSGNLHLRLTYIISVEQDLAVDVGKGNRVVVIHRDVANASGRKCLHNRTAQPAGADDQYMRVVQPLLLLRAEAWQVHLPGGALKFLAGQC